MSKPSERPIFILTLLPDPRINGYVAVRRALKYLLRAFGLKCIAYDIDDCGDLTHWRLSDQIDSNKSGPSGEHAGAEKQYEPQPNYRKAVKE